MHARIAFALILTLSTTLASAETSPVEEASPVDRIFIPTGFDDNDNVEIIMHGDFKDACYRVGRTGAEVNEETKHITVWASAYVYPPSPYCEQTITPFLQSVRVGVLKSGQYTVSFKYDESIQGTLVVRSHTTEAPEDFLYAPVANASVYEDTETGEQTLRLEGHYPYMYIGCMSIKEVRFTQNTAGVVVVQPITEILNGEPCRNRPSDNSYAHVVKLPEAFSDEGLLHVRVLNGDSVNRLIQP